MIDEDLDSEVDSIWSSLSTIFRLSSDTVEIGDSDDDDWSTFESMDMGELSSTFWHWTMNAVDGDMVKIMMIINMVHAEIIFNNDDDDDDWMRFK